MGEPLVASVAQGLHPFDRQGLPVSPELSIAEQFHQLNIARGAYAEVWKNTWLDHDLDVVLALGAVSCAAPHDTFGMPVYTLMWNTIDVSTSLPCLRPLH